MAQARLREAQGQPESARALYDTLFAQGAGAPFHATIGGVLGSAPARRLLQRQQRRNARLPRTH